MKEAFLTIGPIGSGKSTFCNEVAKKEPGFVLVSRDAILIEMFGTVWLDSYTGGHFEAYERMWKEVEKHLATAGSLAVILDCWNGFARERRDIARRLRYLGAERVVGLYFTTPEDTCVTWRTAKEAGKTGLDKDAYMRDYRLFHSQPINIQQGFDSIVNIDPSRNPGPGLLLKNCFMSSGLLT
jgi:predicted kinase